MVGHSAEQRKESNGYHSLQLGIKKQNLSDLARSHSSIPKEKDIFNQRAMQYPHIYVPCMSVVVPDSRNHLD